MTLPIVFANDVAPTGKNLDDNFLAVAAMGATPCTVSGTNTLTLSPIGNVPAVSVYANYALFSGVVASTNTGAVQASVGSAPVLNVYKDTISGPVALATNDLDAGNSLLLMYDSALNAGAGGFHLLTNAQNQPSFSANVATISVSAGTTITTAQLGIFSGQGIILRQGAPGGPYNDTTDTAVNIAAPFSGLAGMDFFFRVVNTSGQIQTLVGGVGVTIVGTATTANGASHDFIGVINSATSVTIYG